jgi:hypothetical protein
VFSGESETVNIGELLFGVQQSRPPENSYVVKPYDHSSDAQLWCMLAGACGAAENAAAGVRFGADAVINYMGSDPKNPPGLLIGTIYTAVTSAIDQRPPYVLPGTPPTDPPSLQKTEKASKDALWSGAVSGTVMTLSAVANQKLGDTRGGKAVNLVLNMANQALVPPKGSESVRDALWNGARNAVQQNLENPRWATGGRWK